VGVVEDLYVQEQVKLTSLRSHQIHSD